MGSCAEREGSDEEVRGGEGGQNKGRQKCD